MAIDFSRRRGRYQSLGEIEFDQLTAALGRPAPSAAAGRFDFQPLAGLQHDLTFRKLRLAVFLHLAGAPGPAVHNTKAGMPDPLRGQVDAHWALAEIAQDNTLAEPAAIFAGAARVCNQLLALGQNRHGDLEHLDRRHLAVRRKTQRIEAVDLRTRALPAMKVLHGTVLRAIVALADAIRGPYRRAAAVSHHLVRN